ncbi:MAG: anti-sigma factor [Cephaloticoccus sp.]|nr:anti-sigma factor [Cephaloticoccus sp.]MCF7760035.1 anti-sigma factor [Cephaloticoccus sp.]
MIDDQAQDLASLYVFDLLEGTELTTFKTAMAKDQSLRNLVDDLRATATLLACTAPDAPPPPALKHRLMTDINNRTQPEKPAQILTFRIGHYLGWAAAACFALIALWATRMHSLSSAENELLRQQTQIAEINLRSMQSQFEAEKLLAEHQLHDAKRHVAELDLALKEQGDLARFKISTLTSMLGNSPQAMAVAVWNPDLQQGVLSVEKLPALASDQDYQLWVIDPQYAIPVDGGVFRVDPTTGQARYQFKADKPIKNVAKFAVSLERKGGVPKAEGPMVLLSQ